MGESQYRYVERDFGRSITNFRKFVRFRRFDADPPPGCPAAHTHTHVATTHVFAPAAHVRCSLARSPAPASP